MKYFIFALCFLAAAALLTGGAFLMRKLDRWLERNGQAKPDEAGLGKELRILMENPVLAASAARGLRAFSRRHPEYRRLFFSAPAAVVRRELEAGRADLGLLFSLSEGDGALCGRLPLRLSAVYSEMLGAAVEPLGDLAESICILGGSRKGPAVMELMDLLAEEAGPSENKEAPSDGQKDKNLL